MQIDIRRTVNFQAHFNDHLMQKIENRIHKYQNKDKKSSKTKTTQQAVQRKGYADRGRESDCTWTST